MGYTITSIKLPDETREQIAEIAGTERGAIKATIVRAVDELHLRVVRDRKPKGQRRAR